MVSTGTTDQTIAPLESMEESYHAITESTMKWMSRRNTGDHGEMLYSGDGYVTTWFMWHLQGDLEAASAFIGTAPELFHNELYQN